MPWTSPAEKHITIDEILFADGADHWDFKEKADTGDNFYVMNPRGIIINTASDGGSYANVVGYLKGEGPNNAATWRLVVGVVHPLCFSHIDRSGTTGQNIKILGS